MTNNPISALFDETKELFIVGLIVIVGLMIFGALKIASSGVPQAQAVIQSGEDSLNLMWILYLGIPSTIGIVLVIWIYNKLKDNTGGLPVY